MPSRPELPKLEPEDTLVPLDLRVGSWYLNVDGRPCHVHSMGKQPNRFKVHVFDEMHGRVLKTSWHDANGAPASGNPGARIAVKLTDEGVPLPRVRREQEAKPAGEWKPWDGWKCKGGAHAEHIALDVGNHYVSRKGMFCRVRADRGEGTFVVDYSHAPGEPPIINYHVNLNGAWYGGSGRHEDDLLKKCDSNGIFFWPELDKGLCGNDPAKLTPEVGKTYRTRGGGYGTVLQCDRDRTILVRLSDRPEDTTGERLWLMDTGLLHDGSKPDKHDLISLYEPTSKAPMPTPTQETTATALLSLLGDMNRSVVAGIVKEHLENAGTRGKFMDDLKEPLSKIVGDTVKAAVMHQLAAMGTREITVRLADHVVTVTSPHPKLEEAINISQAINNVWLCGPAGSGKTTLAHQLADALNLQFGFVSCTTGMSESKLLGRMNVQGTYLPAEFVRIYEEGGVFLWDEFDAADPNVVLCANSAMANGHLAVPDRVDRPVATRHKDTILVIATNTWGRGSTSEYTARETLDAATRDRFVLSKIHVDYAPAIEYQYLGAYEPAWVTTPSIVTGRKLQDVLVKIRANIEKHHLRRVLSTRVFAQAAALRKIGWSDGQILSRYFLDWTEQERTKALEGAL